MAYLLQKCGQWYSHKKYQTFSRQQKRTWNIFFCEMDSQHSTAFHSRPHTIYWVGKNEKKNFFFTNFLVESYEKKIKLGKNMLYFCESVQPVKLQWRQTTLRIGSQGENFFPLSPLSSTRFTFNFQHDTEKNGTTMAAPETSRGTVRKWKLFGSSSSRGIKEGSRSVPYLNEMERQ